MTSQQEPQPGHRHTWPYLQTRGRLPSSPPGQRATTLLPPSLGKAAPVPEGRMVRASRSSLHQAAEWFGTSAPHRVRQAAERRRRPGLPATCRVWLGPGSPTLRQAPPHRCSPRSTALWPARAQARGLHGDTVGSPAPLLWLDLAPARCLAAACSLLREPGSPCWRSEAWASPCLSLLSASCRPRGAQRG